MKYSQILLMLMALMLISCHSEKQSADVESAPSDAVQLTEEQKARAEIKVNRLQRRVLEERVKANGTIDVPPMGKRVMHSFIGANADYIGVIPGDRVKKGQVLIRLSHPNLIDMQQQFLEQKTEMIYQKGELDRKTKLYTKEITSDKEMAQVKQLYQRAKLSYEALSSKLKMLGITESEIEEKGIREEVIIRAPFDGSISKVFVENGQYVAPDQPMIELLDQNHKHLEISVFAPYASRVKKGQKIIFRIPDHPAEYHGEVHLVNPDIEGNILKIHGHFDDPSELLKVGMYIEAEIIVSDEMVTAIGSEEIIREGNNFFLFREAENGYLKTAVKTGKTNEELIELVNVDTLSNWVVRGNYYLNRM